MGLIGSGLGFVILGSIALVADTSSNTFGTAWVVVGSTTLLLGVALHLMSTRARKPRRGSK